MNRNRVAKLGRIDYWLERLQWLLLGAIPVMAMHRYRYVVWRAPSPPIHTPVEFLGIVFFSVDFLMVALVVSGLLRWLFNPTSARHFSQTTETVLVTQGGMVWVGLIVWMGLGVWRAYDPRLARYATLHTAVCLILSLWVADIVRKKPPTVSLTVYAAGAAGQGALAIAQMMHSGALGLRPLGESAPPFGTASFRAYGLTDNPNSLGAYLVVALFGCLALLYATGPRFNRQMWLAVLGLFLVSAGLLTTFSRGAIGAAVVAMVPLGIAAGRKLPQLSTRRRIVLGSVGLLILITSALFWGPKLQPRFRELFQKNKDTSGNYFLNRDFYVTDTNDAIKKSGIFGVGANNLMLAIAHLDRDTYETRYPVHNVYWLIRAELGFPGMILFLIACGVTLKGIRSLTLSPLLIWSCCFLAICLIMMLEFFFWASPHSEVLLFVVLGMIWGESLRKL